MATPTFMPKAASHSRIKDQILRKMGQKPPEQAAAMAVGVLQEDSAPDPAAPTLVLATNQKPFSVLFGVELPGKLKDFAVTVFQKEDWDALVADSIPARDAGFIPDPEVLYWAVYAIERNKRLIITGPPGTGKTTMVRYIAAVTGRPYIRLNGMAGLEPADQIGGLQAKGGETYYALGDAAIAAKYGALLALDEPFKNTASTNMCYMALAEKDNPKLLLYGHPDYKKRHLSPDPRFRLVLCDNVTGTGNDLDKYAATEVQDSAFLNRMSINLYLDYLPTSREVEMLTSQFPTLGLNGLAGQMVKLARELRSAWKTGQLEHPYSPRNLLEFAEAYLFCGDLGEAFVRTYPYSSETSETQNLIQTFWRDVKFSDRLPS